MPVGWNRLLRIPRGPNRERRQVLVVGSGARAVDFEAATRAHPEWGLDVAGFADDAGVPFAASIDAARVHKLADLSDLVSAGYVDEVVFTLPRSRIVELLPIAEVCTRAGVPLTLLTDVLGAALPTPRSTRIGGLAGLRFGDLEHPFWARAVKRGIDVVGACVGLCLAAPVVAVAVLGIRLSAAGPAIFWQARCGRGGRVIWVPKLRTMIDRADGLKEEMLHLNEMEGPAFKVPDDPRVTPIGRVLRRYSLDELPQLWNVLKGEMSLVGPRPVVPNEAAHYSVFERRRLAVRPGLTCLWQVSGPGRHGPGGFSEWMRLDLEYVDTWSLRKDLQILLATLPEILRGENW